MTPKSKRYSAVAALAAAIAIPAEGLRQYAYYDPPGILTVCYGSTTDVQKGKRYSLDECKARLDADMRGAIEAVDRCVPGLPINALAAFSDAVYNIGPRIACDTSQQHGGAAAQGREDCRSLRPAAALEQSDHWRGVGGTAGAHETARSGAGFVPDARCIAQQKS
jgi:GH24 family phage-related lysozyme (muramidase)